MSPHQPSLPLAEGSFTYLLCLFMPMGTADSLEYTLQHFIHFASDSNNDDFLHASKNLKKLVKNQGRLERKKRLEL